MAVPTELFQIAGETQDDADPRQWRQIARRFESMINVNRAIAAHDPRGAMDERAFGSRTARHSLEANQVRRRLADRNGFDRTLEFVETRFLPIAREPFAESPVVVGRGAIRLENRSGGNLVRR